MNSNDLDAGIRFFQRATDSADQSTSADRHDDRLKIGMLLKQFQPQSSLPGNHHIIVEGMDEGEVVLAR